VLKIFDKKNKKVTVKRQGKNSSSKPVIFHTDINGTKKRLTKLEKATDLRSFISFTKTNGEKVGAMLLNRGLESNPVNVAKFVWEMEGFHSNMTEAQAASAIRGLHTVLKEILSGESFRIYCNSFIDRRPREEELVGLFNKAQTEQLEILAAEELKVLQQLDTSKKRKEIRLYLVVSFTIDPDEVNQDFLERSLAWLVKKYQKVSGSDDVVMQQKMDLFLAKAFKAFTRWEDIFRDKLQTKVTAFNADEVWDFCRAPSNRFTDRKKRDLESRKGINWKPEGIPQVIEVDYMKGTIDERVNVEAHPTSRIHKNPVSIPTAGRDHIKVDGKWICPILLISQPVGFSATETKSLEEMQLSYLFTEIICKPVFNDISMVVEFSKAPQLEVAINNQDLIKEAKARTKNKKKDGMPDPRGTILMDEAIETEKQLFKGEPIMNVAIALFPHGNSLEAARASASEITSLVSDPAELYQEVDTADLTWSQGLPYYSKALGVDIRGDRRDREGADLVVGYFPCLHTAPLHDEGLEYIADDSGSPYIWNPFYPMKHTALFGESRSGKSVKLAFIIYRAILAMIPVTIMDRPPSDASSTFQDFTRQMGGDYVDVFHDSLNVLEFPRISKIEHLSDKSKEDRKKQYESFVIKTLQTMVLGADSAKSRSSQRVGGILTSAFKAFQEDPGILNRVRKAKAGGMGSQAWQNYPVLADFAEFCTPERIKLADITQEDLEIFSDIQIQFKRWIDGPYGKMVNSPSTVSLDSPLLTIAMREMSNNDDAAVFACITYAAAMRRALLAPEEVGSILVVDEASLAFKLDAIADAVAEIAANGLKAGIRLIIAAQEPMSVLESSGGRKIMSAITYIFIGRIRGVDFKNYQKHLQVPLAIASKNLGANFRPDTATCSSLWLLNIDDTFRLGRLYFPPSLVKLTASNPDERKDRQDKARDKLMLSRDEEPDKVLT
jgi:hypothetical protein